MSAQVDLPNADGRGCGVNRYVRMSAINSNCSRVDAVKASANQLRIQLAQLARIDGANDKSRAVRSELETLDGQVRTGDAKKAESALSAARSAINNLQSEPVVDATTSHQRNRTFGRFEAYA